MLPRIAASTFLRDGLADDVKGLNPRHRSGDTPSARQPRSTIPFRRALLNSSSLITGLALGLVVAMPADVAWAQNIPSLAGGAGGGGSGQASTGAGTDGTQLGYTGGTGGNSGSTGGDGGNGAPSIGQVTPNSGGAGGATPGAAGGAGSAFLLGGSGGGAGAHGYVGATLPVGSLTGGAGGAGGVGGATAPSQSPYSGYGGGGGGGGFGAVLEANGALGTLAASLTGGAGGVGGNTTLYGYNYAGAGGRGGGGLYVSSTANTSLTITGTVRGGTGGNGGDGNFGDGASGNGGSAIYVVNTAGITTLTLTNTARAVGGNAGAVVTGVAGAAGPGIAGENLNVILAAGSTVSAGQTSNISSPRNAIEFTGGTNSLELQGNGGTSGQTYATLDGNVLGGGTTTLKLTGAGGTFNLGLLDPTVGFSGFTGVTVNTSGRWIVGGSPTEAGPWTVAAGTLSNGLAGTPTAILSGNTSVAAGAGLSAYAVSGASAFTIDANLSFSDPTSILTVTLGAPTSTALITVNGDLTLNGVLNIADAGDMASGTYTLIGYTGSYSGAGLTIGTSSDPDLQFAVSTATPNLVTLAVSVNGLYWNGATTMGTGVVQGGNGTWTAGPITNWLTPDKTTNVASSDNMPALFAGDVGTVTVDTTDGAVSSEGLRFETTGYTLVGATLADTLALATATQGEVPRVNVVGNATLATIALPLTGTQGLEKTGTGRLILTGANTYTGNTKISAGTLQLGDGMTTGTVVGNITNNAALAFNPTGLTAAYAGVISGTGTVEKAGTGWQTLSGNNSYSGVTTVSGGLLLVSSNNALGTTAGGTVVSSGATLGLYGTGITVAEPMTLAGFGAANFGALASFRGNSVSAGTNTVSGAITLAADASIVNSGGTGDVLNLTGSITGTGTSLYLASSPTATNTISGQINTGTGAVGIVSGTWKLSNTNGYTGGTVIAAGAKLILDAPSGNAIGGNIVNNGTLAINNEDLNGIISGSGNIEVGSQSNLNYNYINGANTYTGQTKLIGGYLTITNAKSLGSAVAGTTISNGGVLYIDLPSGAGVIDEPLNISGSGYFSADEAAVTIQNGQITYKGSITLADSARIHVWDSASVDFQGSFTGSGKTITFSANSTASNNRTVSGVIALGSGGVTVQGGQWVFTAQNTYTGVTTVGGAGSFAKLRNNGRIAGNVVVDQYGTYGGSGTSKSVTVKNGGTVAPGNSPGTLTVDGNLTMESGSVYEADVEPSGAHDLLLVNGDVSLSNGASVHLISQPGIYSTTSTLTILSASGTITGSFGTVISDSPFLIPTLSEDGQNIFLTITSRSFDSLAQTPNQFAVAGAAQALGPGNPVFDAIMYVPASEVPQAFDQLSGEIYPSINTVIQQQAAYLRDAVGARLRQSVMGPTATALSYAAKAEGPATAQLAEGLTPTLWMQGFGGWGDTSGNGNAASISNTIGGVIAGLDVGVTDSVRAGIFGGFSRSWFDVDARNSSGDMNNYDIGVYAGGQFGAFALRGGASYSWHDVSVNRTIAFPGFSGQTEGDYTVGTTQLFGEVAYDFTVGAFDFEPFAGLAYLHLSGETFTETGTQTSGAALGVSLASQDTLYSTLGIRAATSVTVGGYALTPSVTLGWQHAFGDTVSAATMLFQGGSTPFQVTGAPIAEDALLLGAGIAYDISDRASLQVNYTGQLAGDASQNALSAQFSLRF